MFSLLRNEISDTMPKAPTPALPDSFEAGLGELETLIQSLEDGSLPLEAQMNAYARGTALLKFCEARLNEAEQKIKMLSADTLVDFDITRDE